MGVLAAILAHARDVAFDVARVQRGLVERRIEQLDQAGVAADEALVHRLHGLARRVRIAGTADDRPALRQRIDLAFGVGCGAEWLAVVEIGAAIPLAVPGMLLDVLLQLPAWARQSSAKADRRAGAPSRRIGSAHRRGRTPARHFRPALLADQVHAVIPVAAAHQRQAMVTELQSVFDGPDTMFVEGGGFFGAIAARS